GAGYARTLLALSLDGCPIEWKVVDGGLIVGGHVRRRGDSFLGAGISHEVSLWFAAGVFRSCFAARPCQAALLHVLHSMFAASKAVKEKQRSDSCVSVPFTPNRSAATSTTTWRSSVHSANTCAGSTSWSASRMMPAEPDWGRPASPASGAARRRQARSRSSNRYSRRWSSAPTRSTRSG